MQPSISIQSQVLADAEQRAESLLVLLNEMRLDDPIRSGHLSDLYWGIDKAIHFFKQALHIAGFWSDFHGVAAGGRDWITAYVGWSLAGTGTFDRQSLLRAAGVLLADRYPSGAWGYRPGLPVDMDSTSWSMLFLQRSGAEWDPQMSVDIFMGHQDHVSGGIKTYLGPEFGIAEYVGAGSQDNLSGWCSAHVCISAVAMQALLACGLGHGEPVLLRCAEFIRCAQHPDGYWNAYWYHGQMYATAQCVRALLCIGEALDSSILQRTTEWLMKTQLPDGSWNDGAEGTPGRIVDTALAVCACLSLGSISDTHLERAIQWLLDRQLSDGSWESQPILQLPPAGEHAPWSIKEWPEVGGDLKHGVCVPDRNRYFTTATVLQALSTWSERKT